MDKTKFAILVGLLLALLFFWKMDAEASVNDTYPSYKLDWLYNEEYPDWSNVYRFNIGTDGIFVDDTNVDYTSENETYSYVSYSSGVAEFSFDTGPIHTFKFVIDNYYLYDFLCLSLFPEVNAEMTYNDYGLSTFGNPVFTFKPYMYANGVKYYLVNDVLTQAIQFPSVKSNNVSFGIEVDCVCSYDATYSSDAIKSLFANVIITVSTGTDKCSIGGIRYISTGENLIGNKLDTSNGFLSSILSKFDISLSTFRDNIRYDLSNIRSDISSWKTALTTQLTNWQTALDSKLDELKNTLTRSYDSSGAQSTNTELSGSLDSWEAAEGTTMSDAKIEVSSYDTSSAFDFAPALVSSMTLITTFANGFFRASGDFSTALIVMIALVFVSVVVGLVRFVK